MMDKDEFQQSSNHEDAEIGQDANHNAPVKGETKWLSFNISIPEDLFEKVRRTYHLLQHTRYGFSLDDPLPSDDQVKSTLFWICIESIGDYTLLPEIEAELDKDIPQS